MARQKTAGGGRSTSERRGRPGGGKAAKPASQGQKPPRGEGKRAKPQGKPAGKAPAPRQAAK